MIATPSAQYALAVFLPLILCAGALAQDDPALVAHWGFDEGEGAVAHDATANGCHAELHGATWEPCGEGHAVSLDGFDDYLICPDAPALDLRDTVTVEMWARPEAIPTAEPMMVGKSTETYGISMYKDGQCWSYISSGGNNLKGRVSLGKWHHIVGTFDGKTMSLWIDRQLVASRESKFDSIAAGGSLVMGVQGGAQDPADSKIAHWRGLLDDVRIYNRALSGDEILSRFKTTARAHGVDTSGFDRVQLTPYHFRGDDRLLVVCDLSGVFPRPADAQLTVALIPAGGETPAQEQQFDAAPPRDIIAAQFPLGDVADGAYTVRAIVTEAGNIAPGEYGFTHPMPALAVPSPSELTVAQIPRPKPTPSYSLTVHPGGGFTINVGGSALPIESAFSYPQGGENRLVAGERFAEGEPGWTVRVRHEQDGTYTVRASGGSYDIDRSIRRAHNRVIVRDTITNKTEDVLGILLDNHLNSVDEPFAHTAVGGYPNGRPRAHSESPSTFVAWDDLALGMLPLDDVYVIQSIVYAANGRAGIRDDEFGLEPGASYSLEWALYPCASTDYYDFINQVRRDENRVGTVEGGFAFIPRENVSREHVAMRNLAFGSFGCLTKVADDPEIEIEGIEFIELPKERARIKAQFDAIRETNPDLKLMFHVAHSLWSTNKPGETFPDARVIDAAGNHVTYSYDYDSCVYFSRRRHEEGWRWYIYYPTPGNSFHDALMRSVDVMVDEIGCNGAFMDGFMFGYGSQYTYDRWDGHTVEIDPETKTVKRKKGSVLLMSQPSMAEFTRRMDAKGAVVIANNAVMTRTMAALPLIVDQEIRSGPDVHLSRTSASLGNPAAIRNEADVYKDVLDKLSWGNLYFYYGEGTLTYPSLPSRMYPITVEELYAGTIKGRERIITMNPGVHGWPGDGALHLCYRFNSLGMEVPAEFPSTVDAGGVRTQIDLAEQESAVIERIPVSLETTVPVNVWVEAYAETGLRLVFNGSGAVTLVVGGGTMKVAEGATLVVNGGEKQSLAAGGDGQLRVPLELRGQARVTVTPAGG